MRFDAEIINSEPQQAPQQQLASPVLASQQLGEVASAMWDALPGSAPRSHAPSNVSVAAPNALAVKPQKRRPGVDRSSVDSSAVTGVWPSLHYFGIRWMQRSVYWSGGAGKLNGWGISYFQADYSTAFVNARAVDGDWCGAAGVAISTPAFKKALKSAKYSQQAYFEFAAYIVTTYPVRTRNRRNTSQSEPWM